MVFLRACIWPGVAMVFKPEPDLIRQNCQFFNSGAQGEARDGGPGLGRGQLAQKICLGKMD